MPAQAATATAPTAARGACLRSITNGNKIIEAVSAMATCAVVISTLGPPSPSESMTGSTSAADEEAMRTAYSGACPVWNTLANSTPSTAATAPTTIARSAA